MKLLFDENLSRCLVPKLIALYAESQHVDQVGLQGQADQEIWRYAAQHGFVIVSKDDDSRQLTRSASMMQEHFPMAKNQEATVLVSQERT